MEGRVFCRLQMPAGSHGRRILSPGDRLPPQRQLAAQLGIDLTTVTRAYDEARRRHLLEGRGAEAPMSAPKVELTTVLDLGMNTPPPPDGVDFEDMLKQGLSQVLMRADANLLMTYHLGGGATPTARREPDGLSPCLDSGIQSRLLSAQAHKRRSLH